MSQRNLLILFITALVSYASYFRAEQNPYARYVAAGFSVIDRWALANVPDQQLFDRAMGAMVDVLQKAGDEHSEFIDETQSDSFREEIRQEFAGIGVSLRVLGKPPLPTVIGPPAPGTPAAQAGLRLADRLEAVDGKSTAGLDLDAVTDLVRGPKGSPVKLTLRRGDDKAAHGGEAIEATLLRALITVDSVEGDLRDATGAWEYRLRSQPRIGYLRILHFGDKTAAEIQRIISALSRDGLDGAILDVRDDPGGALDAAVETCNLFLQVGRQIVTTRERDQAIREKYVSTGSGPYFDLPLAILVDRNSASASEIVAACLQDYGRAAIVGERSYGKGTVQQLIGVESGRSLLKLTTATYWRPSGKNIHRMPGDDAAGEWGVTPDHELTVTQSEHELEEWQRYRLLRDVVGEDVSSALAKELMSDKLPAKDYADRVLKMAVEEVGRKAAEVRGRETGVDDQESGQ